MSAARVTQQHEEDKKPNHRGKRNTDGNEVLFKMFRSIQLKELMKVYCDKQSMEMNSTSFLFDGCRVRGHQTPDELEMEDGDEIYAMLHQTGGAGTLT